MSYIAKLYFFSYVTNAIIEFLKEEGSGSSDSAAELGLDNVGGVFVVLALGCFFGFIMAVLEFLWNIRKIAVEEHVSHPLLFIKLSIHSLILFLLLFL